MTGLLQSCKRWDLYHKLFSICRYPVWNCLCFQAWQIFLKWFWVLLYDLYHFYVIANCLLTVIIFIIFSLSQMCSPAIKSRYAMLCVLYAALSYVNSDNNDAELPGSKPFQDKQLSLQVRRTDTASACIWTTHWRYTWQTGEMYWCQQDFYILIWLFLNDLRCCC